MMTGHLRLNRAAPAPWQYQGELSLPSGRSAHIEASIGEDGAGKFFILRGCLTPGMSSAELEAALVEIETTRATAARRELDATDELPF